MQSSNTGQNGHIYSTETSVTDAFIDHGLQENLPWQQL